MIRVSFVQDNRADLPVTRMCNHVELPRLSLYGWVNLTRSARDLADEVLLETIRDNTAGRATPTACHAPMASCDAPATASPEVVLLG